MRRKLSAGVLMALVFLIPAAPAMAQDAPPVLNAACQPVERKVFKDIRTLIKIDLDTATDLQVRVQAGQILTEANAESLPVLPGAIQKQLGSTNPADLRAFLKTGYLNAWKTDLRISTVRTLTGAGDHVGTAAQKVLDDGDFDDYLAFLNDGLYVARALDCAASPSPSQSTPTSSVSPSATTTPSVTPSATTTAVAIPTSSTSPATSGDNGDGGGLPVTGNATGTVAAIGGVLLFIGVAGYLIGRRRRSRFVA